LIELELRHDGRIGEEREDLHLAATRRAEKRKHFVHLRQEIVEHTAA
jgi:hypothetical protein